MNDVQQETRYRLEFVIPGDCDPAVREAVEKAALRMEQVKEQLLTRNDIPTLLKVQMEIADAITAACAPLYNRLLSTPLDYAKHYFN